MGNPSSIDVHKGARMTDTHSYTPSHPWYYFLGGRPLTPKEIWQNAKDKNYHGYAWGRIEKADRLKDPKRTEKLQKMRDDFYQDFRRDLRIYRQCALQYHRERETTHNPSSNNGCRDIDVSLMLKHNHLSNGFAHLITLDDLLKSDQLDLFDF